MAGPTLYEKLGKVEKIAPMIKDIYQLHCKDPITKPYFDKVKDHDQIYQHLLDFFCSGIGGPQKYTGRDMKSAHKDMGVTGEAFLAIQAHVMEGLGKHGHGLEIRNEVLGILFSLREQVIFKPKNLYEKLGGVDKIKPMIQKIYEVHCKDPITKPYFDKVKDHDAVFNHLLNFFCSGIGGPQKYTGRDMAAAHKGMGVTGRAFIAIQSHVVDGLKEFGHGPEIQNEVLGILFSMRDIIIEN